MNRYLFKSWVLCFIAAFGVFTVGTLNCAAAELDVWLGTSSSPLSKGIYHCTFDTESGRLSPSKLVAEISGPGFLAMHPNRQFLYAVGTLNSVPSVACYEITSTGKNAKLKLDSSAEIGDGGAAHVSVGPGAKFLMTAQYGGGSTAVFALSDEGSIMQRTQLLPHQGGSGVVAKRQDAPHAHWTGFSPDGRFAFVPDLGLDQVVTYQVEGTNLLPAGAASVPPGGGPRHMKFHTSGKWVYVLNELSLSVSVFDYDAQTGKMQIKQTIPTVAPALLAKEQFKSCSEIRVHPNGRFVYAANRGHDTITAFSVDEATGELSVVEIENARAVTPRNFNLTPDGKWALVGGQDSHTLAAFSIDSQSGELSYNRSVIHTPAPICVLMVPEDRLVALE